MRHNKLFYIAAFCSLLFFTVAPPAAYAQSNKSKQKTTKKTASKSSTTPGQYPEASERLLSEKDIEHVTPWGMKVMQNEIYARKGYIFKDATLRKHFRKERWYKGKERNLKNIKLSDIEIQNLAFLKEHNPKAKI